MFKLLSHFQIKLQIVFVLLVLVLFGGLHLFPNTNNVFAGQEKTSKQNQKRFPTFFEGFVTGVQGNTIEVLNGSLAFDLSNISVASGNEILSSSSVVVGSVVRIDYFQPSGKEQKQAAATGAKSLVKSQDINRVIVQRKGSVELGGFFEDVKLEEKSFKIYGYDIFVNSETKGRVVFKDSTKDFVDLEAMKIFKKGAANISAKLVDGKLVATDLTAFDLDGQIPPGARYLGTIRGYISDVKGTMVEILDGMVSLDVGPISKGIELSSLKNGYIYASSHSSELPVAPKLEAIAGSARYINEVFFSGPFAKDQKQSVIIFSGTRILVNQDTIFVESDEDDDGNTKILGRGATGLALLKSSGSPIAIFVKVNGTTLIATEVLVSSKALAN
jgi:hypothetical protein